MKTKTDKQIPIYNKIKQIYLGNILESYYQSYTNDKLPPKKAAFWRKYDSLDNNRSLLYGGDDKILITPERISKQQLEYISRLAGWKNVHNLVPQRKSDSISDDVINDKDIFETVCGIIRANPGVEIIQYRLTPEFYRLAEKLKAREPETAFPEMVLKEDSFIEKYFHSKRGFRHLWEQVKLPNWEVSIPEGFIAADKDEAIEAAWWFKKQELNFVFKYNRGVQGIGVVMNQAADWPDDYPRFVAEAKVKLEDGMWNEPCIVVEQLIEVDTNILGGSPNVELRIDKNGKVHKEYACAQILATDRKTFLGVGMNPEISGHKHIVRAFEAGERLGERLAELGYRGVFDIDLVVSRQNQLFAVEANLRRTGGTHAHEFCKTLLGENYAREYYVHLQDLTLARKERSRWTELLDKYAYDPKAKTGIVPANPDMTEVGKLPLLVVAQGKEAMEKLLEKVNGGAEG